MLAADGEEIPGLYAVGFASSRDYMGMVSYPLFLYDGHVVSLW